MSSSDYLQPKGEIDPDWFETTKNEDSSVFISEWESEGQSRSVNALGQVFYDRAVAAWVYHRAYRWMANKLASAPDSVAMESDSRTISTGRVSYFNQKAQEMLDDFQDTMAATKSSSAPGKTTSIKTRVRF